MATILLFTFCWSSISFFFFFPFFLAFFWVEHILLFHFILSIAFITLPLPFCGFYMNYNMYHSSLLVILCIIEGTYIGTLPFPSSPLCNCDTFHPPPLSELFYTIKCLLKKFKNWFLKKTITHATYLPYSALFICWYRC